MRHFGRILTLAVAGALLLSACSQTRPAPRANIFSEPALRQTMVSSEGKIPEGPGRTACFGTAIETNKLIERGLIPYAGQVDSFLCEAADTVGEDRIILSATLVAGGVSHAVQTDFRRVESRLSKLLNKPEPDYAWTIARYLFDGKSLVERTPGAEET